jgi:hypothetical protein
MLLFGPHPAQALLETRQIAEVELYFLFLIIGVCQGLSSCAIDAIIHFSSLP